MSAPRNTAPRFARALLTNDDGIDAPGMAALAEVAATLAGEVWIVAPEHDRSGASRSVSLHDPLRLYPRGPRRIAVAGTPADCAILGIRQVMADAPPDIVLSGINRGANIGDEVPYSGTVAAAMTARLFGIPALALSQAFRDRTQVRWETARAWLPRVLDWLDGRPGWDRTVLNINFPDVAPDAVTGIDVARQSGGSLVGVDVEGRTDTRGLSYHWLAFRRQAGEQGDGTDVAVLRRHAVAVTPLGNDLTDHTALAALRG
jgi:5'-nucleotidase